VALAEQDNEVGMGGTCCERRSSSKQICMVRGGRGWLPSGHPRVHPKLQRRWKRGSIAWNWNCRLAQDCSSFGNTSRCKALRSCLRSVNFELTKTRMTSDAGESPVLNWFVFQDRSGGERFAPNTDSAASAASAGWLWQEWREVLL